MKWRSERREHLRKKTFLKCVLGHGSAAAHSRVADISLGGCYVESTHLPVIGESLPLTIAAIAPGLACLTGTVMSVSQGAGFSVKFALLDAEMRNRLRRFLSNCEFARKKGSGVSR